MQQRFTRARALAITMAGITTASLVIAPTAGATPANDNIVISEVYGGGGNSGAILTNDFIELFNPTTETIVLDGMVVEYLSSGGNSGASLELTGSIPAGGHFLINMAAGSGGAVTTVADATGTAAMAGANGSVKLFDPSGAQIDLVGYGTATLVETAGTGELSNSTSASRDAVGTDTDDNAADFIVGTPTPTNSLGQTTGGNAGDGGETETPGEHGELITIAEIQGTGAATTRADQTVTTEGVVTATYPEGGKNGFYLQTAGTGTAAKVPGSASDGIFIYLGSDAAATDYPEIGDSLTVTGTANEHYEATQITASLVTGNTEPLATVSPLQIETLPAGAAAREIYEGMLLLPTGDHTVTNNYSLNTHGTIDLAPGTEAFLQATDVHAPDTDPNSPVQQLMAEQAAQSITLDDGRTRNYMYSDKETPLPWISQDAGTTIKSLRTGDGVVFQHPVVLDYSFDAWTFQPTAPVTGNVAGTDLPITWEDSRAAERGAMADVQGDLSVSSFNVLNYFTSLGKDEAGCDFYTDRFGEPVATDYCDVRGAYSEAAFVDQQAKIVTAINELDAAVIGLEEIENTATVTGDASRRDESLAVLVDALNTAAGSDKWAYVESPAELGEDEDYIRVAFIYQPAEVSPVGESRIFNDEAFTGLARQPLAQEFKSATDENAETFVALVNHFKSKGSVSQGDADNGDGQANNPNVRNAQSLALLEDLNAQEDWVGKSTFILGDLNSYSKETAIATLEAHGFENIAAKYNAGESYQFSGRLGSLDHALGNAAAMESIVDADIWDINADESIAFEYSRRDYNIVDFYDDSPFRSSDHDPIKIGFNLGEASAPGENGGEGDELKSVASFEITDAGHLILTYTDESTEDLGKVVGADGQDGRGVATFEVNAAGDLIVTYTDGTTQNLGGIKGEDGTDGRDGVDGENGKDGGSVLETVLGFAAGFTAMGGVVAWLLSTFFPEIRNGVVSQFNSLFR